MRRILANTTLTVLRTLTGDVSDLIAIETNFVPAVLNKVFIRAAFSAGFGLIIIFDSHLEFAKANKARYIAG